jgi:hypothetical protein
MKESRDFPEARSKRVLRPVPCTYPELSFLVHERSRWGQLRPVSWSLYTFGNEMFVIHPHACYRFGLVLAAIPAPANSPYAKPWPVLLIATFVLWLHNRIFPMSQMSSSESSLLGKRTQERPPSSREFATPPRVQRSTVLIHRELAVGYVLVISGAFNLIV